MLGSVKLPKQCMGPQDPMNLEGENHHQAPGVQGLSTGAGLEGHELSTQGCRPKTPQGVGYWVQGLRCEVHSSRPQDAGPTAL